MKPGLYFEQENGAWQPGKDQNRQVEQCIFKVVGTMRLRLTKPVIGNSPLDSLAKLLLSFLDRVHIAGDQGGELH